MKKFATTALMALALGACAQKPVQPKAEATPPPPPAPTKAQAVLKAAQGTKTKGIVHFSEENGKMTVEVMAEGLKSGPHGFHIHEVGDCSAKDFSSAGGHFNPTQMKHGAPGKQSHAGDLGNLTANKKGKISATMTAENFSLAGPDSIIGKSVIVHKNADDLKSQPAGNSGPRVLCGVIEAL
ncbi:MAG TPA: superoxide dismutase family protein [Bdellovibrio sp.]|nr:superoxide dismutase family protein [Bdellovibrio sp.]